MRSEPGGEKPISPLIESLLCIKLGLALAPVARWIDGWRPEPCAQVRFLRGVLFFFRLPYGAKFPGNNSGGSRDRRSAGFDPGRPTSGSVIGNDRTGRAAVLSDQGDEVPEISGNYLSSLARMMPRISQMGMENRSAHTKPCTVLRRSLRFFFSKARSIRIFTSSIWKGLVM